MRKEIKVRKRVAKSLGLFLWQMMLNSSQRMDKVQAQMLQACCGAL